MPRPTSVGGGGKGPPILPGGWGQKGLGNTRTDFHSSLALTFLRLCPSLPGEGQDTRCIDLGEVTSLLSAAISSPIPSGFLPKSDESWIWKNFGNCKVHAQRGMFGEVLEKPKCLAPPSVVIQTRHAFPRQDWPPSSHLSASQSLGWGTKKTWPLAGVTHCQTLKRLLLKDCPLVRQPQMFWNEYETGWGRGWGRSVCGPISMGLCSNLEGPAFFSNRVFGCQSLRGP